MLILINIEEKLAAQKPLAKEEVLFDQIYKLKKSIICFAKILSIFFQRQTK